jgi:hypothetical protein
MTTRAAWRGLGRVTRWPGLAALAAALVLAAVLIAGFVPVPHTVHVLNWMKTHWLNAVAITAFATAAAAVLPLLNRTQQQPGGAVDDERRPRQRQAILAKVRRDWIADVLKLSFEATPRLDVHRRSRLDLLGTGGETTPDGPAQVPAAKSTLRIFDDAGGSLLITGAPGSGKSVFLLELAEDLTSRADGDSGAPVPVILNLSSWGSGRPSLVAWIRDELLRRYDVPYAAGGALIAEDGLALLLDGLDEVPEQDRAACAEQINAYRRDHGLVPIAVCARTEETRALPVRLRLRDSVELQPLTDDQVGQ